MILQLEVISLFMCSCPGYADTNSFRGSLCSAPLGAENSSWTANLNIVFSSLEANVNLNNGFYRAEAGESSDKIYGLIQCRGDVSPSGCQECTRESLALATKNCDGSKSVVIWQEWCYFRYSNASFYGVWEKSGSATSTDTSLDDPDVAAKGMAMMTGLAAAAPNETLMFDKSEMDDGKGGKRYGLAQCSRDLGKLACRDCLGYFLNGFSTTVANKRRWQIYGIGCFMLYDDSRLYFNTSTISVQSPAPTDSSISPQSPTTAPGRATSKNAGSRGWAGRFAWGVTILATTMAYL